MYFRVQTGTKTNHFFSCLCLWGGTFSHILYFGVQTGTNTNLDLVVYVYRVVLFLASCTSMYKQAPKQTYLKLFMFMGWCFYSHLVLWCTNRHQNRPILSCLSLWDGAFSRILYFGLQTGTKTNLVLVIYVYGVVLLLASCTSMYKQAPKRTYLQLFIITGWCFKSHYVLWCTSRHQKQAYFKLCYSVYLKRKTAFFLKSYFTPAQNCVCSLKTS